MFKSLCIVAFAAVGLAACTPADAELDGDIEVGAADPYWTVEVLRDEGKTLISVVGDPSVEGELPVKTQGEKDVILLTSKTPQGDFVMNFTHKECFDGLAETARPWTVTVDWKGELLQGCARAR